MRTLTFISMCVLSLSCTIHAKDTFTSFSFGLALPTGSSNASTSNDSLNPTEKALQPGWDLAWMFFKQPFTKLKGPVSKLSLGGKINYSRWVRDSTLTGISFLGVQGIFRYYFLPTGKPFNLFAQAGCGMFLGEHFFNDPDTLNVNEPPSEVFVTEGNKCLGYHLGAGFTWDIFEIHPVLTIVRKGAKSSAWLTINAAVTF